MLTGRCTCGGSGFGGDDILTGVVMTFREDKKGRTLAEDHVDWFVNIIRPLLVSWFEHGFKHGTEYRDEKENKTT